MFYEGKIVVIMINGINVKFIDIVGIIGGFVGLYINNGGILINNGNILGDKGYGIIIDGIEINNVGNIIFNNLVIFKNVSVGIYIKLLDKIINLFIGKIKLGKNFVGIYGKVVENFGEIEVGDGGIGIYSGGGNVNFNLIGKINVGRDKVVVIYVKGIN